MPFYSEATLYDEAPSITISALKKGKIFQENKICSAIGEFGIIGRNQIEVEVDLLTTEFGVTFRYSKGGRYFEYKVPLVSRESNLGKGKVWYFQCIKTGKRAFKLYMIGDYLLHRDAYPKAMYESQDSSKNERELNRIARGFKRLDELEEKGKLRFFYKGKMTKRAILYMKYMGIVKQTTKLQRDFLGIEK